jgi:hypothetical protein
VQAKKPWLFFHEDPFFLLKKLATPNAGYCAKAPSGRGTSMLNFQLSDADINLIRTDKHFKLYLLCGAYDPKKSTSDAFIEFPQPLEIHFNGSLVKDNVKGLKNKPGSAKPANLTPFIKQTSGGYNELKIIYAFTKVDYLLFCYLVEEITPEKLLLKVLANPRISKQTTLNDFNTEEQDEDDLQEMSTRLSLKCPLSFARMKYPVKSIYCNHLSCFDGLSFLYLQAQAATWTCPICNHSVKVKELCISEYVMEIINKTPANVDSAEIDLDGSWIPVQESDDDDDDSDDDAPQVKTENTPAKERATSKTPSAPVVIVLDSDEEEEGEEATTQPTQPATAGHPSQDRPGLTQHHPQLQATQNPPIERRSSATQSPSLNIPTPQELLNRNLSNATQSGESSPQLPSNGNEAGSNLSHQNSASPNQALPPLPQVKGPTQQFGQYPQQRFQQQQQYDQQHHQNHQNHQTQQPNQQYSGRPQHSPQLPQPQVPPSSHLPPAHVNPPHHGPYQYMSMSNRGSLSQSSPPQNDLPFSPAQYNQQPSTFLNSRNLPRFPPAQIPTGKHQYSQQQGQQHTQSSPPLPPPHTVNQAPPSSLFDVAARSNALHHVPVQNRDNVGSTVSRSISNPIMPLAHTELKEKLDAFQQNHNINRSNTVTYGSVRGNEGALNHIKELQRALEQKSGSNTTHSSPVSTAGSTAYTNPTSTEEQQQGSAANPSVGTNPVDSDVGLNDAAVSASHSPDKISGQSAIQEEVRRAIQEHEDQEKEIGLTSIAHQTSQPPPLPLPPVLDDVPHVDTQSNGVPASVATATASAPHSPVSAPIPASASSDDQNDTARPSASAAVAPSTALNIPKWSQNNLLRPSGADSTTARITEPNEKPVAQAMIGDPPFPSADVPPESVSIPTQGAAEVPSTSNSVLPSASVPKPSVGLLGISTNVLNSVTSHAPQDPSHEQTAAPPPPPSVSNTEITRKRALPPLPSPVLPNKKPAPSNNDVEFIDLTDD